jgi:hypothetical protein
LAVELPQWRLGRVFLVLRIHFPRILN